MSPNLNSPVQQIFWFDHHRRSQGTISQPRTFLRGCVYIHMCRKINKSICMCVLVGL